MTIRIAMWSGPRNISTAMMRAWENRADCAVVDEPFYGAYLATTGLSHPMRAKVLASMDTNWGRVADICASDAPSPVVFQKHMTSHMVAEAPLDWMRACRHAFLIRPPGEVAASFSAKHDEVGAADLGFDRQVALFDHVCEMTGSPPPVIEARDVLAAPEASLRRLCAALGVAFDRAMLAWPPGRRASDGVWAAHWYGAVESSTGFTSPRPATAPDPSLAALVAACEPAYQKMRAHRLVMAPLSDQS